MKNYIAIIISVLFISSCAVKPLDRSIRPKPGPAPEVKFGDAQSFTTANGMKVYVVENHKLPRVSYSIDFDIKPKLEGSKIGTAGMVGDLLMAGTKYMDKNAFNKAVDGIGGTLAVGDDGIFMQSLTKQSDKLLTLASQMLLSPSFPQDELELLKKKASSGLKSNEDDPQTMSRNITSVLNFGKNHYYGEVMNEQTLENITLNDCKNYYDTYFRPNVAYMAIVGDITLEEAKKQVTKYFGAWQQKDVPVAEYETPNTNDGAQVAIVNKSAAVQSVINITYPIDLKPGSEDVVPLRVANGILGGGSTGRLFQNLRETHAWTYGSYSSVRPSKWQNSGTFSATANATAEATDSSISAILSEMNKMRNEKVSKEELDGYKNYMAGTFALGLENPRTLARYAINIAKNNLPADYYKNYLKNVEAVTADDVMRVSKKYIKPDIANITMAGDKASNIEKLKKFGPVTVYDLYGNVEKAGPKVDVPADMTAKKVVENYLEATGGKAKWKAIKDIKMEMNMTGAAPMPIDIISIKKKGGKLYEEVSASMQGQKQVFQKTVFNGAKGKASGMQGEKEITGDLATETKEKATICDELEYLKDSYTLSLVGTEKVGVENCYVINIKDKTGDTKTEYYSMKSGLKLKSVGVMEAQNGKMTVTATMEDYKTINGFKFPFVMKQEMGPTKMSIKVKSVEVNKGVADSVFE